MHILTIISRDLQKASTLYRIVQYLDFFSSRGIDFEFIHRKTLSRSVLRSVSSSDLLFNQKCLFNCALAKRMMAESRRTLFEFDDAIFTRPGKPDFFLTRWRENRRLHLWLERADIVTTPNGYLADYARRLSNSVRIVPMALDLEKWRPSISRRKKNKFVIGWAGAPVNIPLLEGLAPVLSTVINHHPEVELAVFSGKKPRFDFPFTYVPFRHGDEMEFIQHLDIGLLPLEKDDFSMGKSPIKAIQYLACGVPVVGNIFGATKEILNEKNSIAVTTHRDWVSAIEGLIDAPERLFPMGEAGRAHAEANHDMKKVGEAFLDILCDG
jgi:glycosyltransferase involved in cell wall biosynthesis